jgi:hypothetical protein
MNTSRTTFALSKPAGDDGIPAAVFAYLQTRTRMRAFTLVQKEFERSKINKATLAARMKRDPAQLTRLLGAPGNWTLNTVADLLWAISGAVPTFSLEYPLDKKPRNMTKPQWAAASSPSYQATPTTLVGSS